MSALFIWLVYSCITEGMTSVFAMRLKLCFVLRHMEGGKLSFLDLKPENRDLL